MKMKIVIPSHNRSDSIRSLNMIPDSYAKQVYIVVRSGEQYEKYKKYEDKYNVLAFDNLTGIGDKRDAIVRHFAGEKIWMVDDDCLLRRAWLNEEKNVITVYKEPLNEKEFLECMEWCSDLIDKYPYAVLRPQIFPLGKNHWPYKLNSWAFTNAFLNLKILDADTLRYNLLPYTEDVVAFLSTIDAGYDVAQVSKWMVKTARPGNPGGMSDIRTAELMEKSAIELHKLFPKHVKLNNRSLPIKTANGIVNKKFGMRIQPNIKHRDKMRCQLIRN
jgi:hypothetical protein